MRWLEPAHLVGLAASSHRHRSEGKQVEVIGPRSRDVARYAARMRLGLALDDLGARHNLPTVREYDHRGELLEVRQLTTTEDVRALAKLVHDKVAEQNPAAAAALHESLAEIGANVPDHAGTVGFAAAQTLPVAGWVRFAVADGGLGLLATLFDRGARSHQEAITMALSGTSRFEDEADRGNGLPTALARVSDFQGSLRLTSGTRSTTANRRHREHRRLLYGYQGTLLAGMVRLLA